jgi:hypothetical protein
MTTRAFATPLSLSGPLRHPRQMLANQTYGGHESIHDGAMAQQLGFSGAPIEGPTHFSQFDPLLVQVFGPAWFERGCISAHYKNMVVEGEQVRPTVDLPSDEPHRARISAAKEDGTSVLEGTATLGPTYPASDLDERMKRLVPPEKLVILRDVKVGDRTPEAEEVIMGFDQHMGDGYPFTLNDKLKSITEPSPWYTKDGGKDSPWGRAIIPFEMISVLTQYTAFRSGWRIRTPHVGLFADLEIKLLGSPLFVGKAYGLTREVVCLSESKRTESIWVRTTLTDPDTKKPCASILLNHAVVKASFPDYDKG